MTKNNVWIVLAAVALAFAAAWVFLTPSPTTDPIETIQFRAQDPWIVGDTDDAFAYAGEGVRTIQGTATLRIDPETTAGMLEFTLQPDEALAALLEGDASPESSILLLMQLDRSDAVWTDRAINRGTDIGDSRLPRTHATYAGSGSFEWLLDGTTQPTTWVGFWSIGDALRQPDGSIRNQGLVFSPLLRDQSVFSDPNRTELTLLIYDAPGSDVVILHLVFPDVQASGS